MSIAARTVIAAARSSVGGAATRVVRRFSSDLDHTFKRAVATLQAPAPAENAVPVTNMDKLKLYSLFKQSEEGPCKGSRPGMFDPVGRAKYDAWKELGDLPADKAKQQYVDFVIKLVGPLKDLPAEAVAAPVATDGGLPPVPTLLEIITPRKQSKLLSFSTVQVSVATGGVAHIVLSRPQKGNAFNVQMWGELRQAVLTLGRHPVVRVIVISGAQGNFSTGMDLKVFSDLQGLAAQEPCEGRKRENLQQFIQFLQDAVTSLEECPLPVLAAVSGHCIGGAIDLICAADLRFCTASASFNVKEIDLGIVADMGTLQRLPRLVGQQRAAELALTARTFSGKQAADYGLVLESFASEAEMLQHVLATAATIAAKSPLTVRGVKQALLYSRDHSVRESLHQVKLWNSALLQSDDLLEAATSMIERRTPTFKGP